MGETDIREKDWEAGKDWHLIVVVDFLFLRLGSRQV